MTDRTIRSPTFIIWDEARSSTPQPSAEFRKAREAIEPYLLTTTPETGWSDIIGNASAHTKLREAIEGPKQNAELYSFYGMRQPKGILLYGPPGCGKTMFAKAAAATMAEIYDAAQAEFISISGSTLMSPWVGKTEQSIREIFTYARLYEAEYGHKLVVFIDEAEVLFPDRTGRTRKVAPWEESQVAEFLAQLDGTDRCGALVILATNRPEAIDEALLRDGRCDYKIRVERPGLNETAAIVRRNLKGLPLAASEDELVLVASESLFNPSYIIHTAKAIFVNKDQTQSQTMGENFCLEHIMSGAIAASIPRRAKSIAFNRDLAAGTRTGIRKSDIYDAVQEVYEENRNLEHGFALDEFMERFEEKASAQLDKLNNPNRKEH